MLSVTPSATRRHTSIDTTCWRIGIRHERLCRNPNIDVYLCVIWSKGSYLVWMKVWQTTYGLTKRVYKRKVQKERTLAQKEHKKSTVVSSHGSEAARQTVSLFNKTKGTFAWAKLKMMCHMHEPRESGRGLNMNTCDGKYVFSHWGKFVQMHKQRMTSKIVIHEITPPDGG